MYTPPHYRTLGLLPEASPEDIRNAYRTLAKKYHPDTNKGDSYAEEIFKRIGIAYNILSNPESRKIYDEAHRQRIEDDRLRQTTEPRIETNGKDVRINLFLTIEEAARGGECQVHYKRETRCVVCDGKGKSHDDRICRSCNGVGFLKLDFNTRVIYPPGVRDDESIIMIGNGHMGQSRKTGDLSVLVKFKPHNYLTPIGGDLHYRALISLDQYIEGTRIKAPGLNGLISVTIPPRCPDKEMIRISRKGLPAYKHFSAGDFVVIVEHCLPKKLSRKERNKVKELLDLPGFNPLVDDNGFFPRGDNDNV